MKHILVKNITKNNLKNFSVKIPLESLVAIVGPSGSGKTTLVDEVLYENSQKKTWDIKNLPKKIDILKQKVDLPKTAKKSLGEYNFEILKKKLASVSKDDLLVLDEPCAGFCMEERNTILKMLKEKVKKGYSIIAVEHNKEIIKNADYVIELGPGAGKYGGKLIFEGNIDEFKKSGTITAKHVFKNSKPDTQNISAPNKKSVTISKISERNFKDFSFSFPVKKTVCITGCSGAGKTTLLDIAYRSLFKGRNAWKIKLKSVSVSGKSFIRRSYIVPQSPIGENPSSTLGTYTKVWDNIRKNFADTAIKKGLKLSKSDFLADKKILSGEKKFSPEVLSVKISGKNIKDLMELTIDEALDIFKKDTLITRKLKFLQEVGLGYLVLGQKSSTLSGGEAQRVRIANILSKKLGDRCLYILDTPTRGLHLKDIPVLIDSFKKIIYKNNTILIADNREEIFHFVDFRIDLK